MSIWLALGHALGLDHPFEGYYDNDSVNTQTVI